MSDSNGQATRSRLTPSSSDATVSVLDRPPSSSVVKSTTPQNVKREHRWWPPRMGRTAGRVLTGVAAAAVLAAGLGFSLTGDSQSRTRATSSPRALAVRTVVLRPVTSYQASREYTGTIVARRTSQLGFELAGKLNEVFVDEGDRVTTGAELALLDTEHLQTRRQQLVAKRAAAAAQLDEMLAGPRDEDIAAARARLESLEAEVGLLKLQTARRRKLVASNTLTRDEYEQFLFNFKSRQAQRDEARHRLEELLNGTRKEQVAAQRAVVAELQAAIAEVDVDLRKSTLRAPFDGTIARRLADDGTVVDAGQSVFRLVEDQALEAWIGLPVDAVSPLTVESAQRVKIGGRYLDAVVSGRFPEVDPATRTRTVVLSLGAAAAAHVVHGQVVRLQLGETVEADGFWLPSTALAQGARGLWSAFVAAPSEANDKTPGELYRVQRRDVEVLHTDGDRALVRGTLNSGDRVIAGGTHRVVVDQLVRLTN